MSGNHGLIDRILSARRSRVELELGVVAIVQRPAEGELPEFNRVVQGAGDIPGLLRWVVGWEGVTEGVLLGDGSSSLVPWSRPVAELAFADRVDWVATVADEIVRLVREHRARREVALGKPSASSMPPSIESGATTTDLNPGLSTT